MADVTALLQRLAPEAGPRLSWGGERLPPLAAVANLFRASLGRLRLVLRSAADRGLPVDQKTSSDRTLIAQLRSLPSPTAVLLQRALERYIVDHEHAADPHALPTRFARDLYVFCDEEGEVARAALRQTFVFRLCDVARRLGEAQRLAAAVAGAIAVAGAAPPDRRPETRAVARARR